MVAGKPIPQIAQFRALVLSKELARDTGISRREGGDCMKEVMGSDSTCKECSLGSCEYCRHWLILGVVRCACYESDPEGHIKAWERLMGLVID